MTVIRSLSLNIASAGFSRFWQAALQLLLTPVIVHLLGPVAYGLVGFYATITLFFAFLDQAISPLLARELGRSADRPDAAAAAALPFAHVRGIFDEHCCWAWASACGGRSYDRTQLAG